MASPEAEDAPPLEVVEVKELAEAKGLLLEEPAEAKGLSVEEPTELAEVKVILLGAATELVEAIGRRNPCE